MFVRPSQVLCATLFGVLVGMSTTMGTPGAAVAQQHCSGLQLGTWKLKSAVATDLKTGQKSEPYGSHPTGFLTYGEDCRMQNIIISDGRKAPVNFVPTDAERIDLYNTLVAYAGTYSIKGDIISHHVDASWNQAWTGTTQARQFKIDGDTLRIKTLGQKNTRTGRETIAELVWTKVE